MIDLARVDPRSLDRLAAVVDDLAANVGLDPDRVLVVGAECRDILHAAVGGFQWSGGSLVAMSDGRVTADPAIMGGAATIRGTRVTVSAILGQMAAGATVDDLLADFPSIDREDVFAALAFAAAALPLDRPAVAA